MEILSLEQILRLIAAVFIVAGLMGGLIIGLRLLNNRIQPMQGSKKRLKILEAMQIDPKRKAIILKCDEREHLIILGHESETVIESGLESLNDGENPLSDKDVEEPKARIYQANTKKSVA